MLTLRCIRYYVWKCSLSSLFGWIYWHWLKCPLMNFINDKTISGHHSNGWLWWLSLHMPAMAVSFDKHHYFHRKRSIILDTKSHSLFNNITSFRETTTVLIPRYIGNPIHAWMWSRAPRGLKDHQTLATAP